MSGWHIQSLEIKLTKQAVSKKFIETLSLGFRDKKSDRKKPIDRQYLTNMFLHYVLTPATIDQTLLWSCDCFRMWR